MQQPLPKKLARNPFAAVLVEFGGEPIRSDHDKEFGILILPRLAWALAQPRTRSLIYRNLPQFTAIHVAHGTKAQPPGVRFRG